MVDLTEFYKDVKNEVLEELKEDLEQAMMYRWLRDFPRKYVHSYRFDRTVLVVKTRGIGGVCGEELDNMIKKEIFDDMLESIAYEQEVEGDYRFSDPDYRFSDARYKELAKKAEEKLNFGDPYEER